MFQNYRELDKQDPTRELVSGLSSTVKQEDLRIVARKLVDLTLACLGALALFFYFIEPFEGGRTLPVLLVFMAGLVGGFLSVQHRLTHTSETALRGLSQSWHSVLLIPINGGVFAIVLHILFLSGILQGSLFPHYFQPVIVENDIGASFKHWLLSTAPASGPDVAKLFFWPFVAGFCERFVPQIIRRTAKEADKSGEGNR